MSKRHNVYVVELDQEVLNEKKFANENPHHDADKACLFVGMTGFSPDERFQNHKEGYKANRFVKIYGKYLRRKMYEKHNPMTYEEAQKKEVELANKLRGKGHAVW